MMNSSASTRCRPGTTFPFTSLKTFGFTESAGKFAFNVPASRLTMAATSLPIFVPVGSELALSGGGFGMMSRMSASQRMSSCSATSSEPGRSASGRPLGSK